MLWLSVDYTIASLHLNGCQSDDVLMRIKIADIAPHARRTPPNPLPLECRAAIYYPPNSPVLSRIKFERELIQWRTPQYY